MTNLAGVRSKPRMTIDNENGEFTMNEGHDLEDFQVAVEHATKQGYIVHYERVEGGTEVRLITRPKYIRQEVTRFCEVLTKEALAHCRAGRDEKPGDPLLEQKQIALNVEAIIKEAMLTGFAAADAAARDGFESGNAFGGLDMDENGEQREDVVEK
jgi:hypothetical protein